MSHTDQHCGFQASGMPNCREVIDFLMAYIEDELSPAQRAVFEQHLSICPSCVNYLNGYRATVALAKATRGGEVDNSEVPPGLLAAMRAARKPS